MFTERLVGGHCVGRENGCEPLLHFDYKICCSRIVRSQSREAGARQFFIGLFQCLAPVAVGGAGLIAFVAEEFC